MRWAWLAVCAGATLKRIEPHLHHAIKVTWTAAPGSTFLVHGRSG